MIWKCICVIVLAIFTTASAVMAFIGTIFPIIPSLWLGLLFVLFMCLSAIVFFWTAVYIMRTGLKIDLIQKTNKRLKEDNLEYMKTILRLTEKLEQKEV